jgi:succinylglutamate desuccinylase
MSFVVDQIQQFVRRCESLASFGFKVERLTEYAYHISGPNPVIANSKNSAKAYPLTIFGLIHGVEVAGIAVLNEVLSMLQTGTVQLKSPICVALGNPWAAHVEKRFVERDLNRSFASIGARQKREEMRAEQLEKILDQTAYFLDLHQTKEHSPEPFFIFPYSAAGFALARRIAPIAPIITRKEGAYSKEGMCSDEYVNSKGGIGITLELGQNGFTPMAIGVGVAACIRAIEFNNLNHLDGKSLEQDPVWGGHFGHVYTWAAVMDYPESGEVNLRPELVNFMKVKQGEILGSHDGRNIICPADGWMLFPQHYRDKSQPRPKEMLRILRQTDELEISAQ